MSSNDKPLVSVVMPVYNGDRFLAVAIESILTQTFSNYEFLIVDNASQDDSAEIILNYARRDKRIRFLPLAQNRGPFAARNRGLGCAQGPYVAFTDSDDVNLPERLRKQVDLLESNPEIGAVGTHARAAMENGEPGYLVKPPAQHGLILLEYYTGSPFLHPTLMMRRELASLVGGFDETFRYSGDIEMTSRLRGRTRFANIPEILYIYRRYEGQLTSHANPKRDHDIIRMRQRVLERVWREAPAEVVDRLTQIRHGKPTSWRKRRAARRDLMRIIDTMVAKTWACADERPFMISLMQRRLEGTTPRLWQMFLHWKRHHFGR